MFEEVYPYLARLFELPLDQPTQERLKFLSSEALQVRILHAVHDYVQARAQRQPLILVWEDMHWADPSSLEVFESLLPLTKTGLCAAAPLLRFGRSAVVATSVIARSLRSDGFAAD